MLTVNKNIMMKPACQRRLTNHVKRVKSPTSSGPSWRENYGLNPLLEGCPARIYNIGLMMIMYLGEYRIMLHLTMSKSNVENSIFVCLSLILYD